MLHRLVASMLVCVASGAALAGDEAFAPGPASVDYREPSAAVTRLLTAGPPPEPILHAATRRVALVHREGVIDLDRVARPFFGLAGFRFEPTTGTSGVFPLIERVEIVALASPDVPAPVEWRPSGGALLDHVRFSPDGRHLSALVVGEGVARVAVFDVVTGRERVLDVPIVAAWGSPCEWVAADALLCRVAPADRGSPPATRVVPTVVDHPGDATPVRTYANLLESAYEDALFEHYFTVELARVGLDGSVRRLPATRGLLSRVEPSPDGGFAVVTRIAPPYPRLVRASLFPSSIEVWDLDHQERRYASSPLGFGVETNDDEHDDPRRFAWGHGVPATLGWIEEVDEADGSTSQRWMAFTAPSDRHEVARSDRPIRAFGWTTAGTPYFTTATDDRTGVQVHVVTADGVREIWSGSTTDRYGNPGRAVRVNGDRGPVLEVEGRIFLAGDGLGPEGVRPFLDGFDLRRGRKERLFTAEPGVFEVVLGVLDADPPLLVTSRETEADPPNLHAVRGSERTAFRPLPTPYPDLEGVERRVLSYRRADGVALSGTLYLPPGTRPGVPLPTLLWIYPYEFSDRGQAEQLDVRAFRYHRVKGPSPLALLLEGYAVLLNPTVPIVEDLVDADYVAQLVASAEAAVDHLVAIGVADPRRIAVGGRSYGAFSSANLLVHSRRFATAIPMSGAYNRTLTPFGFQHERRSFWEATELYARISPFFHVDRIEAPILLVHGGADENPGTPAIQARRFFHALVGRGVRARYVELPFESHHYWARENVLHAAAEMIDWLDWTIGPECATCGQPTREDE